MVSVLLCALVLGSEAWSLARRGVRPPVRRSRGFAPAASAALAHSGADGATRRVAPLSAAAAVEVMEGPDIAVLGHVCVGCVVASSPKEYDHFQRKSSVLVIRHGDGGSIGLRLDSPTALSIGEATEGMRAALGILSTNVLYLGGDHGGEKTLMIHATPGLAGATPLGASGLFIGGMAAAVEAVRSGRSEADDFKFVFNYNTWGPGELDRYVERAQWASFAVDTALVLRRENERGGLWDQLQAALEEAGDHGGAADPRSDLSSGVTGLYT
ncbi:hypothetical protein M885DRAFT_544699 [Pelagophyceae sp. CCMP2097]|nr:hypothetical protein M885DRAFT_544699 [Pelagophyceae sp. CCMP2097]|mmetsp:Transcript_5109/g.16148  ORF Transcript_5109/g.16148 Transcript_5109/m.16148 type:complete len:270 (-) Transcript_5109:124-933(-)